MYGAWTEKREEAAHYTASIGSVYRVVRGLMNVPSSRLNNANKLHRLWVHEVCRVWADRLHSADHCHWFLSHVDRLSCAHFKQGLDQLLFASSIETTGLVSLPKIYFSSLRLAPSADAVCDEVSHCFNQLGTIKFIRMGQVTEMDAVIAAMEQKLDAYNEMRKGAPLKLVLSAHVAGHVLHAIHALNRPKGHAVLIGEAGRGRQSCAIVSALLLNYGIFQVLL